ncbi:MAG: IclR family transcriptional regulator [Phyllobacteriaceae bacterium]|jgi:DNA-binding IclR family transcriptional regulator|nr:IclR family transcriptional regulator [Phyllobacteriaceae bacterium]
MFEKAARSDRSGIQVIARAAAILRTLKDDSSGLSLGQISERVGLPRSTVQRIAGALASERLVISDPKGGGLRLGPELGSLAEAARFNIVEQCRLFLSELAQSTGETADLSVMRGATMIFLDQVPGTHRLRTVSSVGEVFPLTTTANGRSCLAALDADRARALVLEEWSRRNIDGDIEAFMAGLEEVRHTGLAYDLDEHTPGISAIGFAFADWSGDLHSISVPVPSTRFQDKRSEVEAAIENTARHVRRLIDQSATV